MLGVMRLPRGFRTIALLAVLALAGAACGDDDGGSEAVAPATTAAVVSTTSSTVAPATTTAPVDLSSVEVVTFVDDSRETRAEGGHDGAPDRSIETTVYIPAADEPRPLIVLSHGLSGHPEKFRELAFHWADAGFVVAVPKFPLSNQELLDPWFGDVPEQAGDVAFVVESLDEIDESSPIAGRIDFDRLGLAGVSLGGLTNWTALLDGCCGDVEVDGLVSSDTAFPFDVDRAGEVTVPVLTIHSDADFGFLYDDIRAVWEQMPTPRFLLTIHGGMHAQASENDDNAHSEAYQLASTEFWGRVFGETPWDQDFPAELTEPDVTTFEAA